MDKYRELKELDLPAIDREVLKFWEENDIFGKSITTRDENRPFVFYEGPPSANGMPGIHHVMSRTIKDLFCRYKTLKGYHVKRKGGWDTHGLPVELGVEQMLGIKKEDIGKKISVEEFNAICRKEVMKYKEAWDELTRKMGYWIDLEHPYITFENDYIETLWYLLKQMYEKGLLYKGYTIQPYSPAAGTGLSSHELNQNYKLVKDTTVVAQFKVIKDEKSAFLYTSPDEEVFFLAWTTTPWTLPSNTALAVGEDIEYVEVQTYNPYTSKPVTVILARDAIAKYFDPEMKDKPLESYKQGDKKIPWRIVQSFKGSRLDGIRYEQLMPYVQPEDGDAFKVVIGDFVSTEEGTGIVHIAPSFGADDMRMAKKYGLGTLTLVDKRGRFVDAVTDFAGVPVKNYDDDPDYEDVDVRIAVKLKKENKAFRIEKYEHNYPHCWRTDKPVIYYPLDSWFIRTTAVKDRMIELNKQINWKPSSIGTGRFGNWLENLVDWNLSRSRFWGTPLPIWRTADGSEEKCIGSVAELREEVTKAVEAGYMKNPLPENFDLHKPFIDEIVLVSPSGKPMYRESDLIDVWFDSGAMPYAQWHYPFENVEIFKRNFPADFIAEGLDQTRGWFFTLHAIATIISDSVAFKNVVANGLVLDKNGNKMSKRLGNVVDPFETLDTYGADATRWYMISNSQPWDNLKFDIEGIIEVQRKFFGTLFNTYSFFALYANIDGFRYAEEEVPLDVRPEIDRWILSMLHSLIAEVDAAYEDYEPTRAARAIMHFVDEHLSNWYVRLCRRRFWKGEYGTDKIAAYQTLYTCLETLAQLMSPIAPFFSEFLFRNLNTVTNRKAEESVHLTYLPAPDSRFIDKDLEERMLLAQEISSMVLSLRKKVNIKVRQPLQRILIPVLNPHRKAQIERVKDLILSEVNVKAIEFVTDTAGVVVKGIKPDFKKLGKRLGKKMKQLVAQLNQLSQQDILEFERKGKRKFNLDGEEVEILRDEVEITSEDMPGWLVATRGDLTVALDITITPELRDEGNARELINKIQRLRKEKGFDVTDRISVIMEHQKALEGAVKAFRNYICTEILAEDLQLQSALSDGDQIEVNGIPVKVQLINKSKIYDKETDKTGTGAKRENQIQ